MGIFDRRGHLLPLQNGNATDPGPGLLSAHSASGNTELSGDRNQSSVYFSPGLLRVASGVRQEHRQRCTRKVLEIKALEFIINTNVNLLRKSSVNAIVIAPWTRGTR